MVLRIGMVALFLQALMTVLAAGTHAQAPPPGGGTLVVHGFADYDSDKRYTPPVDEVGDGYAKCEIFVYGDISDWIIPDDVLTFDDPRLPLVARAWTDDTGTASFDLPAGRYSVTRSGCTFPTIPPPPPSSGLREPLCCSYLSFQPGSRRLPSVSAQSILEVQTIDVSSGATSEVTARWHPPEPMTRVIAVAMFIAMGLVVVGCWLLVWKFPRMWDMTPDPDNPKALELKGPDRPQATFDDVFGEFLPKKK